MQLTAWHKRKKGRTKSLSHGGLSQYCRRSNDPEQLLVSVVVTVLEWIGPSEDEGGRSASFLHFLWARWAGLSNLLLLRTQHFSLLVLCEQHLYCHSFSTLHTVPFFPCLLDLGRHGQMTRRRCKGETICCCPHPSSGHSTALSSLLFHQKVCVTLLALFNCKMLSSFLNKPYCTFPASRPVM